MSGTSFLSQEWTRPDELLKLQRLKQKQKALQARFNRQNKNSENSPKETSLTDNFPEAQKRKNPFAKNSAQVVKKTRSELNFSADDTIFQLLSASKIQSSPDLEAPTVEEKQAFKDDIVYDEEDQEAEVQQKPMPVFPVDWSVKSRMRILSKTSIPGNNLKSNQEASGLTGFVRCLDIKKTSSGLDISPGARFHQCLMFWQYPHLPWLNLIHRNIKTNNTFKLGDEESQSLLTDWTDSFRNLFQLLRARQCPYFYVFANTFSVLFRAAGIGGQAEMHAYLSPTSRGFRQLLKQEDIEFQMPLKSQSSQNRSANESTLNSNFENSGKMEDEEEDEDDDEDEEKWLQSLGVDEKDIKRINFADARKKQKKECENDSGDTSIVFIEGVECQAFFNFLLNAKSTVPKVGRLAGIPPTLLAPVGFLGGTLRKQSIRTSKIRSDGVDYFSMELRGVILPHTVHVLSELLKELKDSFSFTMANYTHTVAFTKASKQLLEDSSKEKENHQEVNNVFGRENLSDCGLQNVILENLCRVDTDAVSILERISYSQEAGGFTWS